MQSFLKYVSRAGCSIHQDKNEHKNDSSLKTETKNISFFNNIKSKLNFFFKKDKGDFHLWEIYENFSRVLSGKLSTKQTLSYLSKYEYALL